MSIDFAPMPDENGYFGEYGGQVIPPELKQVMDEINDAYDQVSQTEAFKQELASLNEDYTGRPSPINYVIRYLLRLPRFSSLCVVIRSLIKSNGKSSMFL